jgi:hypothetical protein
LVLTNLLCEKTIVKSGKELFNNGKRSPQNDLQHYKISTLLVKKFTFSVDYSALVYLVSKASLTEKLV